MRKILITLMAVVALVGAACGSDDDDKAEGPTGAQSYVVDVDAAAPPQYQISAYYPAAITVHPGDTIEFQEKSAVHPHTVTFGVKPDQSNRPNPEKAEALVFGPCFISTDLAAGATACPTPPNPAAPPAYAGKGFWSSGVLSNANPTFSKTIKLTIDPATPDGTYNYLCTLHAFMGGTIKVEKDAERLTPTAVRAAADTASAKAIASANALKPPAATAGVVSTDWGDRIVAVMAYDPASISVKAGETVTWKNGNPYEPHTVTFKSPYKSPGDPGATEPHGDASGASYTGGFTSSGFFGAAPFYPATSFSLKFPKAGTFDYVCTIHPGMKGSVVVT